MDAAQSRQPFSYDSDDDVSMVHAPVVYAPVVHAPAVHAPAVHAPLSSSQQHEKERRDKVNRVLTLMARNATAYELLGVTADASEKQVTKAWRKMMMGIHPDKNNKDKSATECAQALNNAKKFLTEDRKTYDQSLALRNISPPVAGEGVGEEFAPNAWDSENDDDDPIRDNDDSENEANYPLPGLYVKKLHEKMTPHIADFFRNTDNVINNDALKKLDKLNGMIEAKNIELSQQQFLHQFPRHWLVQFHDDRYTIINKSETNVLDPTGVLEAVSKLWKFFERMRQGPRYMWPPAWTGLFMDPLHEKLGVPTKQPVMPLRLDDDVDMEDIDISSNNTLTSYITPGYTTSGDPILGCTGDHPCSKYLVKVDDLNPMQLASGAEIGHRAVVAYRRLPQDEKNYIKDISLKLKYDRMLEYHFVEIIGIAWKPGKAGSSRMPDTYIWFKTDLNDLKPTILNRTDFKHAMGRRGGDLHIAAWFESKGIIPKWWDDPTPQALSINMSSLQAQVHAQAQVDAQVQQAEVSALCDKVQSLAIIVQEERQENQKQRGVLMALVEKLVSSQKN